VNERVSSDMQVPSWGVTEAMLVAWGFPVEKTDKVVGTKVVVRPGMTFHKAKHEAWAAGFVRMAAIPESEAERRRGTHRERLVEMRREANENLAFLRAHGSIVGPSHNNNER
jgi:hypothetical protein